jgi:hypothetical protein
MFAFKESSESAIIAPATVSTGVQSMLPDQQKDRNSWKAYPFSRLSEGTELSCINPTINLWI